MLTKEDKTLIKDVWESKKYGVKRSVNEFQNKKWSKRGVQDFQKRLRTTGCIERAPGMDARTRRALLRTLTLWGTWRYNPRHTAPLDRSHESSEYLKQITEMTFSVLFCCERK